jgi:hypothetical protein
VHPQIEKRRPISATPELLTSDLERFRLLTSLADQDRR